MNNYKSPIVSANDELSEGVYTASGSALGTANYSFAERVNPSWTTGKNYDFTITNQSDRPVDSITITVPIAGDITGISGNATAVINGDGTATITFDNYNNGFEPSETVGFWMQVTGNGDFGFK